MLLYVLRDVFCGIQKWRFENALVKLKMCKSILVVIARVVKIYNETQVFSYVFYKYSIFIAISELYAFFYVLLLCYINNKYNIILIYWDLYEYIFELLVGYVIVIIRHYNNRKTDRKVTRRS